MMCENITILDDRMQEMDEECCGMLMFVPVLPPNICLYQDVSLWARLDVTDNAMYLWCFIVH